MPALSLSTIARFTAALALSSAGIVAHAQLVAETNAQLMPAYVVTGSNIPLSHEDMWLPVTELGRSRIESSGVQTTYDLLQSLPQAVGQGNYRGEQYPNPGGGESKIALRGLPASATLVLVNGRRVALTSGMSVGINAVNLNTIPLAAVERVEVLRDGAGPVYGSDAIAGVVNVVLRNRYRGGLLTAEYGNTTRRDAGTLIGSLVVGTGNESTDLLVTGSWFHRNAVYSRDRDIVRTADYRRFGAARGGTDWRLPDAPRSRLWVNGTLDPVGAGLIYSGQAGATGPRQPAAYRRWSADDGYDFRAVTAEVLPQTRQGLTLAAGHKLSDSVRVIAEAGYTKVQTFTELAPAAVYSDSQPFVDASGAIVQLTVPIGNRYNPFGAGSYDGRYAVDAFYKRFVELGTRTTATDVHNVRLLAGLQGNLADWRWEVAALHSSDRSSAFMTNLVNKRELYAQLQNTSTSVASVDVFGDWTDNLNDPARRAALERIRLNALSWSAYRLDQTDAKASGTLGSLPAGPVGAAVGVERRREEFEFRPDAAIASFNTIGASNQLGTDGSRTVTSVFAELSLPLVRRVRGIEALDLSVAGRAERYSDFGSTANPGVSLRWKPAGRSLVVRGSFNRGFRAPSLQELFLGDQESFDWIYSPTHPDQPQVRNVRTGNPGLDPEKSRSWSFGLVFRPESVANLSLHLDHYSIFKRDNIGLLGSQFVFDQFAAGNPAFRNAVQVNPVTGYATSIGTSYANLGKEVSRGLDYGFSYAIPTRGSGRFTFDFEGSYVGAYLFTATRSSPYIEAAGNYSTAIGNSLPRNRTRLDVRWELKGWSADLTWSRIAGLKECISAVKSWHVIEDYNVFDVQVAHALPFNSRLTLGVANFTDEKPPFIGGAGILAYDSSMYDVLGRRCYLRLERKF